MATYSSVSGSDADAYARRMGFTVNNNDGSGSQYIWKKKSIPPNLFTGNQILKGQINSDTGNTNVFALGNRIYIGNNSNNIFAFGSDHTIVGGQTNNFVVNYNSGSYVKNVR